jgi:DNA-binding MarR family transcriptional regulator
MSRRSRDDVLDELGFQFRAMQTEFEDHDAAVGDLLGLNTTDMRVLDFLGRTGDPNAFDSEPTTAGDLARASGLTTGAVTAVIDRLATGGWVRRRADPADRRRVVVELTDQAVRRTMEIYRPLQERGRAKFDGYTIAELELVLRALRASREITLAHTEELRRRTRERESGGSAAA